MLQTRFQQRLIPEARQPSDTIEYTDTVANKIEKVTATLRGHDSAKYTVLANKLEEISRLTTEIKKLQGEVKAETKELIVDLFDAADAAKTRVVETVSVTLQLSKDPKPTETIQYAKVLDALEKHLTPELITVLTRLKEDFKSTTQKSPSLELIRGTKVPMTDVEVVKTTKGKGKGKGVKEAGVFDTVWAWLKPLKETATLIKRWATNYDKKLLQLRALLDEVNQQTEQEMGRGKY